MRTMLRLLGLTLLVTFLAAACAFADGPYEPNETAATATGPVTDTLLSAALETPQDEDWYLLRPNAPRQIGVLATLKSACPSKIGSLVVHVFDADGSRAPLADLRLGYRGDPEPTLADRMAFTSIRGHRYYLQVTQSSCMNTPYDLSIEPADALSTSLETTIECARAHGHLKAAKRTLERLRKKLRRSHGAARRLARSQYGIQKQAVTVAKAGAQTTCTRPELTGYPWE